MIAALWLLLRLLLLLAVATLFGIGDDPFALLGSSGSLADIAAPTPLAQFVLLAVVAITLLLPAPPGVRAGLLIVGLAAALLGSHRVVFDIQSAQARDLWLGMTLQTLPFNPDSEDVPIASPSGWGVDIRLANTGQGWRTLSPPIIGLATATLPRLQQP